ncbi:MAG: S-layer family protein, partial [Rhodospirillaceae bacterium]|nr:S-layer family protein [Rhodospirillaceae bacterium]
VTPANTTILHLTTGGAITGTAGGIVETNLALTAGGTVNFTDTTTNVTNLAVSNAGQAVTFTEADGVAIDTVDAVVGVTAAALTVNANNGVTVNNNVTTTGTTSIDTDLDNNGTGDFTIATATALNTTNSALSITANDMVITGTGTLNSGGAATTLLVSDLGTMGLGGTALNWTLSGAELQQITATGLTIGDANNGNMTVNGITAANLANITGTTILNATAATRTITFDTAASAFGALTVNADDGVTVNQNLTTTGTTTIDTDVDNDGVGNFTIATATALNTGGTALTITANDIAINGTGTLNSGAAATMLRVSDAGTIDLGTGGAGGLNLTDTELDLVTAGSLTIGDGTAGAITVRSDLTPANITFLHLRSGSTITGTAGGIVETNLALTAGGSINFTDPTTDVDNLAVSAAGQTVSFRDIDDLDIDTVNGIVGVTATTLNLTTGGALTDTQRTIVTNLSVSGSAAVTLDAAANDAGTVAINTTAGNIIYTDANAFTVGTVGAVVGIDTNAGTVALTATTGNLTVSNTAAANDVEASGDITLTAAADEALIDIQATADVESTGGAITVVADDINIAGTITNAGRTVTLAPETVIDADVIDLGPDAAAANRFELTNADIDNVTAGTLVIGTAASGALTVEADITPVNTTTLHLNSVGAVTATAGGIVETNLAVTAGGTVNFTDTTTNVSTLAVSNAGQAVTFTEADSVTIGTVDGVAGVTAAALTVNANNGLTINNDVTTTGITSIDTDLDNNGTGDFTIATATALSTTNNALNITANDITITGTGTLNSGAAATTFLVSDGGTMGLGGTALNWTLSGAELQQITATGLTIGDATNGNMTVNGITAANSANITGTTTLNATVATGTVTFDTAASAFGALTLNADDGVTVNQGLTTTGALTVDSDLDNDGVGNFTTAAAVSTGGNTLSVTANDFVLGSTLNSGAGDTSLLVSDGGTVGLGLTAGAATITGAELQNVTAANLTIGGTTAQTITVDGISAANSANIAGTVTLEAGNNAGADVDFSNNASSFRAVTARADDAVNINANLTTTVGAISLIADTDGGADAVDAVVIGALLAPAAGISLSSADGLTISNNFSFAGDITLNADGNNDGVGLFTVNGGIAVDSQNNALTITAADFNILGTLNSGTGLMSLLATNGRTIGVGDTARNVTISKAELGRMTTTGGLTIGGANAGSITVDNIVRAADLATIGGTVTLDAGGAGAAIDFSTADSSFNALTLTSQAGVTLNRNLTTTGVVSIDTDTDNNGAGDFTVAGAMALNTGGNALSVTANDAILTGTLNSGAAAATSLLVSDGGVITLGGAGAGLSLSAAEMNNITASKLTIGDNTAGAITIAADITPGGTTLLNLVTGGAITGTAGGIIETSLAMTAGGTIDLTNVNTDVTNLAVSAAGQTVSFRDANAVDINTVDGVAGVTAGAFTLTAGGAATGAGTVTVTSLAVATQSTTLTGTVGGLTGQAAAAAATTQAPLGPGPHLLNGFAIGVAPPSSSSSTPATATQNDAVTVSVAAENSLEAGTLIGSVSSTPDGSDSDSDSTPQEAVVQDLLNEPFEPDIYKNPFRIVRYSEDLKQVLGLSATGVDDIWSDGDALSPPELPANGLRRFDEDDLSLTPVP